MPYLSSVVPAPHLEVKEQLHLLGAGRREIGVAQQKTLTAPSTHCIPLSTKIILFLDKDHSLGTCFGY